ncbi:nucleotidyltransferase [Pantoea phage Nifs112]|nr:nucleotidyltransferase [Pantoea phage Nifs112]
MKTIEDLQELQSKLRVFTNEYGFLAGGCIRDFLFHTEPKDYDFVIPCKPSWGKGEVFAIMSRISGQLSLLGYSSAVYAAYEDAGRIPLSTAMQVRISMRCSWAA